MRARVLREQERILPFLLGSSFTHLRAFTIVWLDKPVSDAKALTVTPLAFIISLT